MKSQRISLFIHENLSTFQYIKGKMLPHQNDVSVSWQDCNSKTVKTGLLPFLQSQVFRKKNMSKLILLIRANL